MQTYVQLQRHEQHHQHVLAAGAFVYACMKLQAAVFSVIFGNKWEYVKVDYDHEFWMKVSTQAFQFWQMVEADIEPTKDYGEPIDWTKIAINGLVARDASDDNYFMDLAYRFVNGSQAARS